MGRLNCALVEAGETALEVGDDRGTIAEEGNRSLKQM